MPAPTFVDGAERGIKEIAPPSPFVILAVILADHYYGLIIAGFSLLGLTILFLITIFLRSKYWNIQYTTGYLVFAILALLMIPGIISEFVHPAFATLTNIAVFIGILAIGWRLIRKLGFNPNTSSR